MKPAADRAELCCSFIYDPSWLNDYEIACDELNTSLGMGVSAAADDATLSDVVADMERMQPLAFHACGSIRGAMAITEDDLDWLRRRIAQRVEEIEPARLARLILPRGAAPVPQLHMARLAAMRAIRCLVHYEKESKKEIPPAIPAFLNLSCNLCFLLSVLANQRRGLSEPEFVSKSYRYFARQNDGQ